MGLPKVEFTQCTPELLAMAVDHEHFPRVLQFRGRDIDDMDLQDMREFAHWVAQFMCGKVEMIPMPEEPEPEAPKKKAGAKGKE